MNKISVSELGNMTCMPYWSMYTKFFCCARFHSVPLKILLSIFSFNSHFTLCSDKFFAGCTVLMIGKSAKRTSTVCNFYETMPKKNYPFICSVSLSHCYSLTRKHFNHYHLWFSFPTVYNLLRSCTVIDCSRYHFCDFRSAFSFFSQENLVKKLFFSLWMDGDCVMLNGKWYVVVSYENYTEQLFSIFSMRGEHLCTTWEFLTWYLVWLNTI